MSSRPDVPRRATPPNPAEAPAAPTPAPATAAPAEKRPRAEGAPRKPPAPRAAKPAPAAAPALAAGATPGPPRKPVVRRVAKPAAPKTPKAPAPQVVVAKLPDPMLQGPRPLPPSVLRPSRRDRLLTYALGVSLLLHLVILTIHFRPFDLKSLRDRGPPLEVALVNARTLDKPTKADILAQANLDGGGNTDANRRAKTPLPVLPKNSPDSAVAVATQKVEALERQTKELLTQLQARPAVAPAQ
ncbi:MAG: hypothetical protein ABIO63_06635, partial [Casimicrobiaceae bacterium]